MDFANLLGEVHKSGTATQANLGLAITVWNNCATQ